MIQQQTRQSIIRRVSVIGPAKSVSARQWRVSLQTIDNHLTLASMESRQELLTTLTPHYKIVCIRTIVACFMQA